MNIITTIHNVPIHCMPTYYADVSVAVWFRVAGAPVVQRVVVKDFDLCDACGRVLMQGQADEDSPVTEDLKRWIDGCEELRERMQEQLKKEART